MLVCTFKVLGPLSFHYPCSTTLPTRINPTTAISISRHGLVLLERNDKIKPFDDPQLHAFLSQLHQEVLKCCLSSPSTHYPAVPVLNLHRPGSSHLGLSFSLSVTPTPPSMRNWRYEVKISTSFLHSFSFVCPQKKRYSLAFSKQIPLPLFLISLLELCRNIIDDIFILFLPCRWMVHLLNEPEIPRPGLNRLVERFWTVI